MGAPPSANRPRPGLYRLYRRTQAYYHQLYSKLPMFDDRDLASVATVRRRGRCDGRLPLAGGERGAGQASLGPHAHVEGGRTRTRAVAGAPGATRPPPAPHPQHPQAFSTLRRLLKEGFLLEFMREVGARGVDRVRVNRP